MIENRNTVRSMILLLCVCITYMVWKRKKQCGCFLSWILCVQMYCKIINIIGPLKKVLCGRSQPGSTRTLGGPCYSPEGPQAKFSKLRVRNDILEVHDAIPYQNGFYHHMFYFISNTISYT